MGPGQKIGETKVSGGVCEYSAAAPYNFDDGTFERCAGDAMADVTGECADSW